MFMIESQALVRKMSRNVHERVGVIKFKMALLKKQQERFIDTQTIGGKIVFRNTLA